MLAQWAKKLKDRKMIGRKMLIFPVLYFSVFLVLACPGWVIST